jgi:hypothetical protein
MNNLRFSKTEWALLVCICCVVSCLISACAGVRTGGDTTDPTFTGVAAVIARVAVVTSYLGSIALVLCGIAVYLPFITNKLAIAKYAAGAFTSLIIAGLLYFLAEHEKLAISLAAVCLGGGLLVVGYCHRKDIEKRLGIKDQKKVPAIPAQ